MKKIIKSIFSLTIIFACILTLCSCFELSEVKSFELTKSPEGTYKLNASVDAKDFEVTITFTDGKKQTMDLTDENLTVQGLDGKKLDTRTIGNKTLKISYQGFSIVFNYFVISNASVVVDTWENHVSENAPTENNNEVEIWTGAELAYVAKNVSQYKGKTLVIKQDIDLKDYEWKPIDDFYGTLKSDENNNYKIYNLKIVNKQDDTRNGSLGLFGIINLKNNQELKIENVNFDNIVIEVTRKSDGTTMSDVKDKPYEIFKNYATLIGHVDGTGNVSIENVNVTNTSINGVGRIAGLIGCVSLTGKINIKNSSVDGTFGAANPVSAAESEGEGDKVGGLVGQIQNQNADTTIENCSVKVRIKGTRDLGAVIGWANNKLTIKNVNIQDGSSVSASVSGGMNVEKGTRNVGGVIGTLSYNKTSNSATVTFDNVTIGNIFLNTNAQYEYSHSGKYIGGLRREGENKTYTLIISLNGSQLKDSSGNDVTIFVPIKAGEQNNTIFRENQEKALQALFSELN